MNEPIKIEVFQYNEDEAYATNHYIHTRELRGSQKGFFMVTEVAIEVDFGAVVDFPSTERIRSVLTKQDSFTFLSLDEDGNTFTRYKISKEV